MVYSFFIFAVCFLTLKTVSQVFTIRGYHKRIQRETLLVDRETLPKAVVMLSVRGGEPSLGRTLDKLLHQDYPDYEVHVVIDSETDPGWEIAQQIQASDQHGRLKLQTLQQPLENCSLKCSSLIQAYQALPEDVEILAFVDSDVIPNTDWLWKLVSPIVGGETLLTSGQRWYQPHKGNLASYARAMWNAGAIIYMEASNIPWGGSMAMSREFMERHQIVESWASAFTEDTVYGHALKTEGIPLRLVPEATLIDDSDATWPNTYRFVRRQMFNTRQEKNWKIVGAIIVTSASSQWGLLIATIYELIQNDFQMAGWLAGGWLLHLLAMTWLWLWEEKGVRLASCPDIEPRWGWGTSMITTLTTLMYLLPATTIASAFLRFETWRGITYDVRGGPWKARMIEYKPYS